MADGHHRSASSGSPVPDLWAQYQQLVALYSFYLDLFTKIFSAYWLLSGGVLTLALTNSTEPAVRWTLLVPTLMSATLCVMLVIAYPKSRDLRDSIFRMARTLGLEQRIHAELLHWFVQGCIGLSLLLAAGFAATVVVFPLLASS